MPSRVRLLTLLLSFASVAIVSPVRAQMATPDPALAEVTPVVAPPILDAPAGPTLASATLGYNSVTEVPTEMTWNNQARAKNNSGPVLAIVGGAALIGGLLIGDDAGTAIAVGGLIMGLIGLYLWLK
jgi:hypothetical protein